jgi:hypothetical protein
LLFTNKGMTNTEWMITIGLIFIVIRLSLVLSSTVEKTSDTNRIEDDLNLIRTAIIQFNHDKHRMPKGIDELYVQNYMDHIPICPLSLQPYWYAGFSYNEDEKKGTFPADYFYLSTPYNVKPGIHSLRVIYCSWSPYYLDRRIEKLPE